MSHETQEMTDFLNGASLETMKTGPAFRHYHKLSADACAKEALKKHGKEFGAALRRATEDLREEHAAAIGEFDVRLKGMEATIADMAAATSKKSGKDGK